MQILVTGASGMLAYDLIPILKEKHNVIWYDRDVFDITNIDQVEEVLKDKKVDLVVNCAAYTDVEKAEDEWNLLNYQINALGVYNLAKICNKLNIDIIHMSTDYVFDGTKKEGYLQTDTPNPINQYGMAKYLWEKLLQSEHKKAIIVRTSWLYGGGKQYKNFVNTMLKLAETKKEISVVGDQFGSPTYTKDLASAILTIIEDINKYRWNIIHVTNETEWNWISWYDFAKKIFEISWKNIMVNECDSGEFATKAVRPRFSKLINNIWLEELDWDQWLKQYINN